MVISAEAPPPPPPDPVADAAAVAATSGARQGAFSSFPSLKSWGRPRVPRCGHVNRSGETVVTTARRPAEKLREVGKNLLRHHDEVEAAGSDAPDAPDADAEDHPAAEESVPEPAASSPSRQRTRRRRRPPASASPSTERRPPRAARGEPLGRPRFSVALTSEEIDEDIYAVTGKRARRRPRRRPRAVQKQVDMLLPGSCLSEITAETYRVPDDR